MSEYEALNPSTLLCPVPAVLVSCRDCAEDARPNALTIAWAGTVNSEPPMVSISVRPSRHSHGLISRSGEFVVNVPEASQCAALDYCGVRSGRDQDKLAACGLETRAAKGMRWAPAIEGCPLSLSCRVTQCLPLGSHELFLAEVVAVEVRKDLLDSDGALHLERVRLLSFSHGLYQQTGELLGFFGYSVARPKVLQRRMAQLRGGSGPRPGGRSSR